MLGSVVLDLAIGMAFIYLLLSLIASVLQEMLASLIQARSAVLQRGLQSLFSGDSLEGGQSLVESIYDHGLIRGLYQDPVKDYAADRQEENARVAQNPLTKRVAQLENFELSAWSKFRLWLQQFVGAAPVMRLKGVADPLLLPSYIPPRTFALALVDILNRDKLNGQPLQNIKKLLVDGLSANPGNKAAEALMALAADAKGDLVKFQTNLEEWFKDSMDRVSGWYKKHTQELLFIIGLGIAIVFNVDSIRVAETLWVDRDARQGMVAAANEYVQNHPSPPTPQAKDGSQPEKFDGLANDMRDSVKAFDKVANEALLPVGWQGPSHDDWAAVRSHPLVTAMHGLFTLVGWIITAAALSLGAPFWFDILGKFMVVRSTIKPQAANQGETTKTA